jgi:hypothetical protein
MAGSNYLSSARTSMVVLLLLLYIAIEGSVSLWLGTAKLAAARDAFAVEFVRNGVRIAKPGSLRLTSNVPINEHENVFDSPARTYIAGVGQVFLSGRYDTGSVFNDGRHSVTIRLGVRQATGERWTTAVNATFPPAATDVLDIPSATAVLQQLADEINADVENARDYAAMFRRVQAKLTSERTDPSVSVPGVGLPFRWRNAIWIIAITIAALLVMIRYDLRHVVVDRDGGIEDPWLLADGADGLELIVATLWLCAMAAAPWIVGGALAYSLSLRMMLFVPESSWAEDIATATLVAAIQVVGFWASVTVVTEVLELRSRRRDAWARELAELGRDGPAT